MEVIKNIKKIVAFGLISIFALGGLVGCTSKMTLQGVPIESQEQLNSIVNDMVEKEKVIAKEQGVLSVDITKDNEKAIEDYMVNSGLTYFSEDELNNRDKQIIEDYKKTVEETVEVTEPTETEEVVGYVLDDISLNEDITTDISDRDLETLQDTEVEFDGDDYDVEEVFSLSGLTVETNKDDYEGNTYLNIPSEGIIYTLNIDSTLDTSDIDEDETLTLNFMGEELEITDWDSDKVTFNKGVDYVVKKGDTIDVSGKSLEVKLIGEDYVYVSVNGVNKKIDDGEVEEIDGIEVELYELLYSEKYDSIVTLKVGETVSETIEDGDEYEEDSPWEYVVDSNSIGLKLVEEFNSIDEDEDFKALSVGDLITLPNNFLNIVYDNIEFGDTEDYKFKVTNKNSVDYIKVRGEFIVGINDYDTVYINESGTIFDEDFDELGTSVELGDTDLTMDTNSGKVKIDDLEIEFDFSDVLVNNNSIANFDEDYITDYGIVIENPEDNIEDEKLNIVIPEEEVEVELRVY